MFCNRCGHFNPDESVFCARCGANFEDEDSAYGDKTVGLPAVEAEVDEDVEVAVTMEPLEKGSAVLVIKRGPDTGMRFTINRDVIVIGRHPESDIFLDDITVSREHAEIRREAAAFTLVDTGSLNGTYLNRERIEASSLSNGDEIQIGKFRLLFFVGTG